MADTSTNPDNKAFPSLTLNSLRLDYTDPQKPSCNLQRRFMILFTVLLTSSPSTASYAEKNSCGHLQTDALIQTFSFYRVLCCDDEATATPN